MTLNYKILGQGFPVIILHGLFGSLDNWLTFGKKIEDAGFMAILIDQRDHGKSPHSEAFNYSLLAEDVYQFMMDHWIHEAIIIGHSMGGKTAMTLAKNYPEVVSKLIVIDISPEKYAVGHSNEFDALFSLDLDTIGSRKEAEIQLTAKLHQPDTVQFFLKNLGRNSDHSFAWKFNLPLLYKDYKNILDAVNFEHTCDIPTLFVKGGKSPYISKNAEITISQIFSQVEITTIPSAGHWVHADALYELLSVVLKFIQS